MMIFKIDFICHFGQTLLSHYRVVFRTQTQTSPELKITCNVDSLIFCVQEITLQVQSDGRAGTSKQAISANMFSVTEFQGSCVSIHTDTLTSCLTVSVKSESYHKKQQMPNR